MKKNVLTFFAAMSLLAAVILFWSFQQKPMQEGYILDHEKDLAVKQPGPHNGSGNTTAFSFFANAKDSRLVFRKRILHQGASIGYHPQNEDEIYYVVSGKGEMRMNDKSFKVAAGDAILTRPGSSHGISQEGTEDLVLIINYEK